MRFAILGAGAIGSYMGGSDKFDHARSLRFSDWRVVWEVVVLGTADKAFEILRQNAAIGWMMLTMVEGISRSEGGMQLGSLFQLRTVAQPYDRS